MKNAEFLVRALENEGVEYIFGIPGEENVHLMDALLDSNIRFVLTRHEQGAAFMADVYGRLTGKAGVCLSTLGPGASNLITGFADANMDGAPIVAIAGQGATTRMHKESHQVLDLTKLFEPISKYSVSILTPDVTAEVISKAFKVAQTEKPGGSFVEVPENIASAEISAAKAQVLPREQGGVGAPQDERIQAAAAIILNAEFPIVLIGNGVIRDNGSEHLKHFVEALNIPAANTFMAKGALPASHPLSLGTIGLQSRDYVACGFSRADVVICIGYDIVEYHPHLWHPDRDKILIHINACVAEVDAHYCAQCEVIGEIRKSLDLLRSTVKSSPSFNETPQKKQQLSRHNNLKQKINEELNKYADDKSFPLRPQNILWQLRQVLDTQDIVISDVGAHKMWIARMYQAEAPNTCIISNGFAAMGIALPGAIAAKLVHPERNIVAVTGDGGFMMNSQEIETALRIKTPIVILIWRDGGYGLIEWHQLRQFGRSSNVAFNNPDFVRYAESFGAKGFRIESADTFQDTMREALNCGTVAIVDCPVDYSVNMEFTEEMGKLVCPI